MLKSKYCVVGVDPHSSGWWSAPSKIQWYTLVENHHLKERWNVKGIQICMYACMYTILYLYVPMRVIEYSSIMWYAICKYKRWKPFKPSTNLVSDDQWYLDGKLLSSFFSFTHMAIIETTNRWSWIKNSSKLLWVHSMSCIAAALCWLKLLEVRSTRPWSRRISIWDTVAINFEPPHPPKQNPIKPGSSSQSSQVESSSKHVQTLKPTTSKNPRNQPGRPSPGKIDLRREKQIRCPLGPVKGLKSMCFSFISDPLDAIWLFWMLAAPRNRDKPW